MKTKLLLACLLIFKLHNIKATPFHYMLDRFASSQNVLHFENSGSVKEIIMLENGSDASSQASSKMVAYLDKETSTALSAHLCKNNDIFLKPQNNDILLPLNRLFVDDKVNIIIIAVCQTQGIDKDVVSIIYDDIKVIAEEQELAYYLTYPFHKCAKPGSFFESELKHMFPFSAGGFAGVDYFLVVRDFSVGMGLGVSEEKAKIIQVLQKICNRTEGAAEQASLLSFNKEHVTGGQSGCLFSYNPCKRPYLRLKTTGGRFASFGLYTLDNIGQ